MAEVSIRKIKAKGSPVYRSENSNARLSARKIGLDIPEPTRQIEQEESDVA